MSIINVVVITDDSQVEFQRQVNDFLRLNEEMVMHDKTVYGITPSSYYDEQYGLMIMTMYSAIFQMEGDRKT